MSYALQTKILDQSYHIGTIISAEYFSRKKQELMPMPFIVLYEDKNELVVAPITYSIDAVSNTSVGIKDITLKTGSLVILSQIKRVKKENVLEIKSHLNNYFVSKLKNKLHEIYTHKEGSIVEINFDYGTHPAIVIEGNDTTFMDRVRIAPLTTDLKRKGADSILLQSEALRYPSVCLLAETKVLEVSEIVSCLGIVDMPTLLDIKLHIGKENAKEQAEANRQLHYTTDITTGIVGQISESLDEVHIRKTEPTNSIEANVTPLIAGSTPQGSTNNLSIVKYTTKEVTPKVKQVTQEPKITGEQKTMAQQVEKAVEITKDNTETQPSTPFILDNDFEVRIQLENNNMIYVIDEGSKQVNVKFKHLDVASLTLTYEQFLLLAHDMPKLTKRII